MTFQNKISGAILFLAIFASCAAFAQKDQKVNKDHANHFGAVDALESSVLTLEIKDAWARAELMKFRASITNKSGDYVRVNTGKFEISADGKTHSPVEKSFLLEPFSSKSKTIEVRDGSDLHVESFVLAPAGFTLISAEGTPVEAADFQLPASVNSIEAGDFSISLKKLEKETKETEAVFVIKYKGDDFGMVDPSKISIEIEGGQKFANDNRKAKTALLANGESTTVKTTFHIARKVVDMQFATMHIKWGESLVETTEVPLAFDEEVTFDLDPGMTAAKNK